MGNSSSSSSTATKFTTRIWRVSKVFDDNALPFCQGMDPNHLSTWIIVRHFGACEVEIYVNGSQCKTSAHGNRICLLGIGTHEIELVIGSASWLNSLAEMQLAVDRTVIPEITAMSPDANHANPFTCHVLCQHQDQFELCIGQAHEYRTVWRTYEEVAKLCENVQAAKHLHCCTPLLPRQCNITELDKYLNALCVDTKALAVNPDCMAFFGFIPSSTFGCCTVEHSNKYSPKPHELAEIVGGPSPTKAVLAYVQRLVHEYQLESTLQFLLQESNIKPLLHGEHRDLTTWIQTQVPLLLEVIKNKLAQPPSKEPTITFPQVPKLNAESLVLDRLALKLLSCSFAECFQTHTQQPWQRLYATHSDGNSFQMMATALEFYPGPALIVIQTTKNHRLGALSTTRWKEDSKFYSEGNGGGGALFSLDPSFAIYHRTPTSNKPIVNVQYLNSRSRTLPLGVGFGGTLHAKKDTSTTNCPRLWIDEDFSQCFTSGYDTVYASGPLLGEGEVYFKALYIEVWGLGGKSALEERNSMRAQKDRMINNQKKVKNKAEFANNAFDREYLLGGTFNPNESKGGNAN